MARGTLPKKRAPGQFGSYAANAADLPMTAADAVNKNQFVFRPGDTVIAWNSGVVDRTITVNSVALAGTGRTGDIGPYTIGASEHAIIGPFDDHDGFRQSDGYIYVEASHEDVKFGVIEK